MLHPHGTPCMSHLLSPLGVGPLSLKNRLIVALKVSVFGAG